MDKRNATGWILSAVSGVMLAGCASPPPKSTESIARAEASIESATRTGAEADAAMLGSAREKLALAKAAAADDNDVRATQLAQQAEADAVLAAARGSASTVGKSASEVQQGVDALREEAQRSVAEAPNTPPPSTSPRTY